MTRLITLFLLLVALGAHGQKLIEGRVIDNETGKPIPFASIGIVGTAKGTSTNMEGEFSLVLDARGAIKITCVGYESVQLSSLDFIEEIRLTPKATQLKDVVIFSKGANPMKIVRKALMGISQNYPQEALFQTYFYRHYCQDDGRYGRLIEAYVDVWRKNGYQGFRHAAGYHEDLRVTQLRRSLDGTAVAQSHEPLDVDHVLLADVAAYQSADEYARLDFYAGLSNLRKDLEDYDFSISGLTNYDGEEVFEIKFKYPTVAPDNAGKYPAGLMGSLFVTTDRFAIVRYEETRFKGNDTIRTSAYYQKYNNRYIPYHLTRDGGTYSGKNKIHWFHIELMSIEVSDERSRAFEGKLPDKNQLLAIGYDSAYWKRHSALAATPLEKQIIYDLGGGQSLEKQFELYQQYELNTTNGGVDGEKKLQWLIDFSRNQKPLVLCYWQGDYAKSATAVEQFKQLNKKYRSQATFAMVSLDENQSRWLQTVQENGLSYDGMLQYRIGSKKISNQLVFYQLSTQQGSLVDLLDSDALKKEIESVLKQF